MLKITVVATSWVVDLSKILQQKPQVQTIGHCHVVHLVKELNSAHWEEQQHSFSSSSSNPRG
jgi:hypothetical protein